MHKNLVKFIVNIHFTHCSDVDKILCITSSTCFTIMAFSGNKYVCRILIKIHKHSNRCSTDKNNTLKQHICMWGQENNAPTQAHPDPTHLELRPQGASPDGTKGKNPPQPVGVDPLLFHPGDAPCGLNLRCVGSKWAWVGALISCKHICCFKVL